MRTDGSVGRLALEPPQPERGDLVEGERDHARCEPRIASRGDVAIVERMHDARDLLALLVPLAGDHDDVAGLRARPMARRIAERRSGSISTSRPAPCEHVLDDRERILAARVVRGDDGHVRKLDRDSAHQRPLVAVAVAARAEDDDQPPLPERRALSAAPSRANPGCARSRRGR